MCLLFFIFTSIKNVGKSFLVLKFIKIFKKLFFFFFKYKPIEHKCSLKGDLLIFISSLVNEDYSHVNLIKIYKTLYCQNYSAVN